MNSVRTLLEPVAKLCLQPQRHWDTRHFCEARAVLKLVLLFSVTAGCLTSTAYSQDRFRTPIPLSELAVGIENFATIPDSRNRQPPRLSVLTPDPTGRLFVNDQRGPLYTMDSSGSSVSEYLDIRDFGDLRIVSTSEAGFQSFAFHPDFASEGTDGFGRLYTIHSSRDLSMPPDFDTGGDTSFHTLLLEWNTDTPLAQVFTPADGEQPYREVLRIKQPFPNHNAGLIAFNYTATMGTADYGNLYIGLGDGGSGGDPQDNGQDASNPLGAVLRIDPIGSDSDNGQYGIVADNVLAADGDSDTLGEIYASGLRNPQRFGWDTATGKLFIADIGQNAVEEIDLAANGANFGWDDREGSFRFDSNNTEGLTDPVAEYDHTRLVEDFPSNTGGRAVTVGEVARDTGISGLDGLLMIGDFPTGLIFTLDVDNDPLDGGQEGLLELQPLDDDLQPTHILDLINQTRSDRGLSSMNRADVRFGINTPGQVFITNKHDGIVRRLTMVPDLLGDCNNDRILNAEDLACVATIEARDAVLEVLDTLPGDLDGNGDVSFDDFLKLAENFEMDLTSYADGNVDLVNGVNFDDFLILAGNFGKTPEAVAAVPEPAGVPIIVAVVLLCIMRSWLAINSGLTTRSPSK